MDLKRAGFVKRTSQELQPFSVQIMRLNALDRSRERHRVSSPHVAKTCKNYCPQQLSAARHMISAASIGVSIFSLLTFAVASLSPSLYQRPRNCCVTTHFCQLQRRMACRCENLSAAVQKQVRLLNITN